MWSRGQRRVVLAITIGILVYLSVRSAFQHNQISNPQPADGPRAAELADRLDPNTASAAQIAAIPGVGEKLAETIVAYREARLQDHPGKPAFAELKDLLRIKGIGVARM